MNCSCRGSSCLDNIFSLAHRDTACYYTLMPRVLIISSNCAFYRGLSTSLRIVRSLIVARKLCTHDSQLSCLSISPVAFCLFYFSPCFLIRLVQWPHSFNNYRFFIFYSTSQVELLQRYVINDFTCVCI